MAIESTKLQIYGSEHCYKSYLLSKVYVLLKRIIANDILLFAKNTNKNANRSIFTLL